MVSKILFITLSNIGDVILTLPVLDTLRANFTQGKITVMVGPRPAEIFKDNPNINKLIVYDKHSRIREKIKLFKQLQKENFDMVVDLRNSLFGAFLKAKYRTSPLLVIPKSIRHMKDRHLFRLPKVTKSYQKLPKVTKGNSLYISSSDEKYINDILNQNSISKEKKIVIVAPGARSHIKRWDKEKFIDLISRLIEGFKLKVILVGDKQDISITKYICDNSKYPLIDLAGKTSIGQLAHLLKKASLLITNDSAVLHLASYLNIPSVAIFGPTNEKKYGPWSKIQYIAKKEIFCRPCQKAQCRFGHLKCMQLVKVEEVYDKVKKILVHSASSIPGCPCQSGRLAAGRQYPASQAFERILIIRTDRIGDVLLSTPVIKALRDNYPYAYIAMMVRPYAYEIVRGNPFLDGVMVYDKYGIHKSWLGSMQFALKLRRKRFNLAIILHPTNRVHFISFFAGIARRIGYKRKLGFLLTDRIKHTKQLGEKHEIEYSLDLIRYLGIEPENKSLFMPISQISEKWLEDLFNSLDIGDNHRLLAIHPGASCPSKIWPAERFAKVCDRLIKKFGFKVFVLAGSKDKKIAENLIKQMQHPAVNLAGKTSVSQLASLLKRCQLFISNDSGPVHIASAVGTPVISIFGRNQKGLSPIRWGPVGEKDKILHKEVGCIECLAHNCNRDFACLKAISVDEVIEAAESILK